jgi:Mrp family chromosome partitioning ATPase
MRGGRRKLPVLAELSGPASGEARAWALRRADLEALAKVQGGLDGHRAVLVGGDEALAGAIAVGAAASAAGRRTALIECDLAQPRLAAELGLNLGPGLHEYLRWEASATEILQPVVLAGPAARGATDPMVCVVAGRPANEAATLVNLESFRHALAKLRSAYELVILAGPKLDSSDIFAAAARADTLLAAVTPAAVSGRAGRDLRARLRRLPVPTHGVIVLGES